MAANVVLLPVSQLHLAEPLDTPVEKHWKEQCSFDKLHTSMAQMHKLSCNHNLSAIWEYSAWTDLRIKLLQNL